ncbi:MAG: ABC transporter ATP-binding protein [Halioglobus sp.]
MPDQLQLDNVSVSYGSFEAASEVSFSLQRGHIGCLLGPSGCGKTTLLRAIAGFEPLTSGAIRLNQREISSSHMLLPTEQRNVGMVFQDFALFPHLNIARNVGFGLEGKSPVEHRERVAEMLALVSLEDAADAFPHQLSGGQQQRVALARALAPNPELLLMDEPFSSLDRDLREQLATEVRDMIKQAGVTAILVSHDQQEAFAMSDQVTVMSAGRVAQTDTPYALYHNPKNRFVAEFVGQGSIISVTADAHGVLAHGLGTLSEAQLNGRHDRPLGLLMRPEDIKFSAGSELQLKVIKRAFRGAHFKYDLALPDNQVVSCLTPSHIEVAEGERLPVAFDLQHLVIFDLDE